MKVNGTDRSSKTTKNRAGTKPPGGDERDEDEKDRVHSSKISERRSDGEGWHRMKRSLWLKKERWRRRETQSLPSFQLLPAEKENFHL